MIIPGEMENQAETPQQVHFPLESVQEETEDEEQDKNNNKNELSPRDDLTQGPTRVPSQRSRAMLIRTPANDFEVSESQLELEKDFLITELKDDGDYGSDISESEEEVDIVLPQETNKPQLTEDDYDTDLEADEEIFYHDTTGKSNYLKICQQYGLVPISYFVRHITDNEITMRYHGLSPTAAKAIALVLRDNISLEKLNLDGNWIQAEGGEAISKMLEENEYITDLSLADNKLGSEGAQSICRMLNVNAGLRKINLSGNGFIDSDAKFLVNTLENNKYLKDLNLSHNLFGEEGGEILGAAIGANDILDVIDLSWNHLRQKGAIAVANGIKENVGLKRINLSWNGFGSEGGCAIADALATNNSLLEIDISGNRLTAEAAIRIAKSIFSNDNLRILRMGNNLLTTAGAIALAKVINESESTEMEELDLTDVPVEYEFLRICEDIKMKKPDFKVSFGPVLRTGNTSDDLGKMGIDPKKKVAPILVLQEHIVVNDMRLLDILKRYDSDQTLLVTPEDFMAAIEELAVPYDKPKVQQAVFKLADDQSGRIYFGDFLKQQGNQKPES
ncbi:leucine-rich repeat-containing protein 74B-like [Mytilus trossulus]|uniref:leucine-rich repeat-containing protein 74B-like n=1 Tax=Mytilus trossulus TaxID=6551 RepID=UPI00300669CD